MNPSIIVLLTFYWSVCIFSYMVMHVICFYLSTDILLVKNSKDCCVIYEITLFYVGEFFICVNDIIHELCMLRDFPILIELWLLIDGQFLMFLEFDSDCVYEVLSLQFPLFFKVVIFFFRNIKYFLQIRLLIFIRFRKHYLLKQLFILWRLILQ